MFVFLTTCTLSAHLGDMLEKHSKYNHILTSKAIIWRERLACLPLSIADDKLLHADKVKKFCGESSDKEKFAECQKTSGNGC